MTHEKSAIQPPDKKPQDINPQQIDPKEIKPQDIDPEEIDPQETEPEGESGQWFLDATGLYCPEPVMLLHNKIRDMNVGDNLQLKATDPSTTRDVPRFCIYLGHELVESSQDGEFYFYTIRKQGGK